MSKFVVEPSFLVEANIDVVVADDFNDVDMDDLALIFGKVEVENGEVLFSNAQNLESLCAELGVYPSKSQARKAGRTGEIPEGLNMLKLSKRHFVCCWKVIK